MTLTKINAYTRIGAGSVMTGGSKPLQQILNTIDKTGDAAVLFLPLTPEILLQKTGKTKLADESYLIDAAKDLTVYYTTPLSRLYALYTVRRNYTENGYPQGVSYHAPKLSCRGYRAYLPAKEEIGEFKAVVDFLIAFGYQFIMLEIAGAMEFLRHPEIHRGWVEYCEILTEHPEKPMDSLRISPFPKNSVHTACGNGSYLTRAQLKELVDYCKERDFEIIPEVPSLSHAAYLLYNHPEYSEYPNDPLPNNACPRNPGYRALINDVIDEVIEVFAPKRINIGHDEAYVLGLCPLCRDTDAATLFAEDVTLLHDHLASKGVTTMMWSDKITPCFHGGNAAVHRRFPKNGKTVQIKDKVYDVHPFACLTMEQWEETKQNEPDAKGWYVAPTKAAIDLLPKDIELLNWVTDQGGFPDSYYADHGYRAYFANAAAAEIHDFLSRAEKYQPGVVYSNWNRIRFETTQMVSGLFHLGYNGYVCWDDAYDAAKKEENTFAAAKQVYDTLNHGILSENHIEIIHTTDTLMEHENFQYDYLYDPKNFTIGQYEITHTDGSTALHDVVWGIHIGYAGVNWEIGAGNAGGDWTNAEEERKIRYRYEPIGRSCPTVINGKTYYRTCFALQAPVEKIRFIPNGAHEVEIYQTKVIQKEA